MRKGLILLSLLCGLGACGSVQNTKGLHTVDGTVPLYIDGAQSGTRKPLLNPALLEEAKTARNLGDALRILGPAYLAPDDPAHTPRWYFEDKATLTLWPQGQELLSDAVWIYPNPGCGVPAQQCKALVMGRNIIDMEQSQDDVQGTTLPSSANHKPVTIEDNSSVPTVFIHP